MNVFFILLKNYERESLIWEHKNKICSFHFKWAYRY